MSLFVVTPSGLVRVPDGPRNCKANADRYHTWHTRDMDRETCACGWWRRKFGSVLSTWTAPELIQGKKASKPLTRRKREVIPTLMRNRNQGMNWIRLSTRLAIYSRDGFVCAYCGAEGESLGQGLTLDHVLACELGGSNEANNLITACLSCNSAKQAKTTRQWFQTLRDRGIKTGKIAERIRRQTRRKLDRKEGLRLAQLRKGF